MNRWSPERTRQRFTTRIQDAALRRVAQAAQIEQATRLRPYKPVPGFTTLLRCVITEKVALATGVSPIRIGKARTLGRLKAYVKASNTAT